MPSALVLLADGFEEIETFAPVDLLRRAGVDVTVVSLNDNRHATGRSHITAHGDVALSAVETELFDLVFVPGGAGVKNLRADPRVRPLLLRHAEADRWIAAICAGPTVLLDAGLLHGKRYTAHPSVENELPEIQADERIVIDGKLLTSRGAGTAVEFGLALVGVLTNSVKAQEISKAICA